MRVSSRYDRQVRAFGEPAQQRFAGLTVAVVGVGGVGSLVVQSLAQLGVGRLLLVDPDTVATTNLNRLAGATTADVTVEKVRVAERVATSANSDVTVRVVCGSVLDDDVWRRLRAADVVVGAVDGHAPRWVLNRLAVQYARCYVDVGVALQPDPVSGALDASGHVAVVRPNGPCLLCLSGYDPRAVAGELQPELAAARRAAGYRVDVPDEPTPSVVFLNQVVAGHAVAEVVNWVVPWRPAVPYLLIDLAAGSTTPMRGERHPECGACGPGSARGLSDADGTPGHQPRRT